jgi:hypothetical protein
MSTVRAALDIDADVSLIPVDGRVGPFTSNGSVSPDPVHPYLLAAEDAAARVVPAILPVCAASAGVACVGDNYRAPLERLYRRSLTESELDALAAMIASLEQQGVSSELATRAMLTSALLGPDFLFRASPAGSAEAARSRRLAEHLSYVVWDGPPDAALLTAVDGSAAELGERLRTQAARLVADSQAVKTLARFLAQWLRVDTDLRSEDPAFESSPRFLEFVAFVEDALANDVPVRSLLTAPRGFVHRDNLDAYGLDSLSGDADVVAVDWPTDSARRGVLGQDLLADSTRHPDASRRPIFRGLLVRRSLLCNTLPLPDPELIALAGEVSDRTQDGRCSTCHLRIDPIGRAFASLDPDADGSSAGTAEIIDHAELAGTYADLPALLEAVAGSRAFAECFARHWLGFFLEQPIERAESGWVSELADAVVAGASLGSVVEQSIVALQVRSETVEPWCTGP